MRRFVALLGVATLVGAPAAASESRSAPALALVKRSPLKVRGFQFKPRESVRVTAVTSAGHASVVAIATRGGRLAAAFKDFSPPPCLRLVVKAHGARGDRARLVVDPPRRSTGIPCGI